MTRFMYIHIIIQVCEMTTNLSYQDEYPRSYYMPYDPTTNPNGYNGSDERTVREQTLLGHAIEYIEAKCQIH
jgi:hypothetical protein